MSNIFRFYILIFSVSSLISSCSQPSEYFVNEIKYSFGENTMFPNVNGDGSQVLVSYIQSIGDTLDQLLVSIYDGNKFSDPQMIRDGKNWFVNWADYPAVATINEHIIASWLDKSAKGTYDYDIKMSISNDNGSTWNDPFVPHKDSIAAEHGFVSIVKENNQWFHAIWLDGRNTVIIDEDGKETYGQMTLRAASIDLKGKMSNEVEIDNKVCDCCQTDLIKTDQGIFAVYRDRSDDEIRDIFYSIYAGDIWSEPKTVHDDGWKISGCPVNGPVIGAFEDKLIVTWYTEANENPHILLSSYDTVNEGFAKPILVDDQYVLGRLDIDFFSNGDFIVSYLKRNPDNTAEIIGKIYNSDNLLIQTLNLGSTSASRSSGFPKLKRSNKGMLLIYTDVSEKPTLISKFISTN